jgi:hypothetical protein
VLLLQGIAKNYMPDQPTETQLQNQSDMLLSFLCLIISLQNIPWELGASPGSFPQFSRPYQALSKWESEVDNLLTLVQGSVEFLLRIQSNGIRTDGGKQKRDLYNEAEHIIFSKHPPKTDNFGTDGWTKPVSLTESTVHRTPLNHNAIQFCKTKPNSESSEVTQTFWDVFGPVPLSDELPYRLLGLRKGKIAL